MCCDGLEFVVRILNCDWWFASFPGQLVCVEISFFLSLISLAWLLAIFRVWLVVMLAWLLRFSGVKLISILWSHFSTFEDPLSALSWFGPFWFGLVCMKSTYLYYFMLIRLMSSIVSSWRPLEIWIACIEKPLNGEGLSAKAQYLKHLVIKCWQYRECCCCHQMWTFGSLHRRLQC